MELLNVVVNIKKSYYVVKTIPAWGQPSRFGANHSNLGLSDAVWGKTIFHGNSSGYDKKIIHE